MRVLCVAHGTGIPTPNDWALVSGQFTVVEFRIPFLPSLRLKGYQIVRFRRIEEQSNDQFVVYRLTNRPPPGWLWLIVRQQMFATTHDAFYR